MVSQPPSSRCSGDSAIADFAVEKQEDRRPVTVDSRKAFFFFILGKLRPQMSLKSRIAAIEAVVNDLKVRKLRSAVDTMRFVRRGMPGSHDRNILIFDTRPCSFRNH